MALTRGAQFLSVKAINLTRRSLTRSLIVDLHRIQSVCVTDAAAMGLRSSRGLLTCPSKTCERATLASGPPVKHAYGRAIVERPAGVTVNGKPRSRPFVTRAASV